MFYIIQTECFHYLIAFGKIYLFTFLNRDVNILRVTNFLTLHLVLTYTLCV